MKKLISLVLSLTLFVSSWFAQVVSSLPYAMMDGKSVSQQHFFQQSQIAVPYTQSQCLLNNGVYKNVRNYLWSDVNNDDIKDYWNPTYLADNFRVVGNENTRYTHLITADLTNIYYYLPQSSMMTLWYNNINFPLSSNRLWYRQSKIAPVNQRVRAISSEPTLLQAPNTTNLADRVIQVAYQIVYKSYNNKWSVADNFYQFFPVQTGGDFSSNLPSWFLNSSYDHNAWWGPIWPNNYTQTGQTIISPSITWWPANTHGLECLNYHLSRCGDGYIDVSGQQPIDADITQPYPISDSGVNEQCDPWANLSSYTDDIMPNGVTPTAYYNCTATCTIINNPQPPILAYTKTVRNVTTNSNNGQFVEADNISSAVVVKTWDVVQYQITINESGWPVTNTILTDPAVTDNGFSISAYSISGGSQIPVSVFPIAGINLTSQLNTSSPVVITLYGTVTNPTATQFVNTATLTDPAYPAGVPTRSVGSNVAWTMLDNTPPPTPDVSIKKEIEVSPNSNTRQELSTVTSGQTVRFKITYQNISNINVTPTITDTLPTGLTCVSALYPNGTTAPCISNGISYYAGVLNPWVSQSIIVTAMVNSALPSNVTTNTATITLPAGPWLPNGIVKSDPAQVQPQSITDFIITKRILSGSVMPGTVIKYEIGFKNAGNSPISSYILTDPLQSSTYVAGSSRLNNSIVITPSYISNLLTRWCNSTNTALNGQMVCPLKAWASGTIVFDVLVN